MNSRYLHFALAALAALTIIAIPALGATAAPAHPMGGGTPPEPMMPLEIGNRWEYQGTGGLQQVETITGTRVVLGRTVWVKSYTVGPDAGLDNWWLYDAGGQLLLAGFDNTGLGLALGYEPPIVYCGSTPSLGDLWPTHVIAYTLPSMAVYDEFDITFGLLENLPLTLPAGTFPSFGVGQVAAPVTPAFSAARGVTLDGRRLAPALKAATTNATDWFSPGVGLVQYQSIDLFQLTGYGSPTAVRATSWGMLKQLYR